MTDTFTYAPDYNASASRKPTVKAIKFGSGYEQRTGDGINTLADVWQLSFSRRTAVDGNAIDAFLTTQGGIRYFLWTPPGGVQAKYICREWTKTIEYADSYTVSAKFEQVFDPA